MGTIDFLHGPGCSVDLVFRLPTMCINTDVLCLANSTLQKTEGGGGRPFLSRGHLRRRYFPRFAADEKLCVFQLIKTRACECVKVGVVRRREIVWMRCVLTWGKKYNRTRLRVVPGYRLKEAQKLQHRNHNVLFTAHWRGADICVHANIRNFPLTGHKNSHK